jgi:hypothetical protein
MLSIGFVLALLVAEIAYILFGYDPAGVRTQAGLMIVFALEMSFVVQAGNANIEEKKEMGRTSRTTRIFNAAIGLPLLALIGLGVRIANLQHHIFVWIVLFVLAACGKIGWLRYHSNLSSVR